MTRTVDSVSDERVINNSMRHQYRVLSEAEKTAVQKIKDLGLELYDVIGSLGETREYALAKTKLEEAVMWAVRGVTQ